MHIGIGPWAQIVREKASFLPENLDPLAASGQLNLVSGRHDLFPGVEMIPVDGHTKAMQLVRGSRRASFFTLHGGSAPDTCPPFSGVEYGLRSLAHDDHR